MIQKFTLSAIALRRSWRSRPSPGWQNCSRDTMVRLHAQLVPLREDRTLWLDLPEVGG